MTIVVGSDIPTGNEVEWFYGGIGALVITEDVVEDSGTIALTKKAEYGCVITRTAAGAMTTDMTELSAIAPSDVAATETTGTSFVRTSAAGTDTMTVHYLDIETTALKQIIGCKDISSPYSIDTKETEVHNQTQKLQKTGAAARTLTLEQVTYNMLFKGAVMGDIIEDSPATGMVKFTDKYTSVKKMAAVVGKQYISGVLTKKWFYLGVQLSKLDNAHPCADFYANSMDFLIDASIEVDVVPNA